MAIEPGGLTPRIVHADRLSGAGDGDVHSPINAWVQFGCERTEDLIDAFQGKLKNAFTCGRQGTAPRCARRKPLRTLDVGASASKRHAKQAGVMRAVRLADSWRACSGGDFVCFPGPTAIFDFDGFTAAASQAYGIPGESWTAKLLLLDGGPEVDDALEISEQTEI